jgi:hypothetical protein
VDGFCKELGYFSLQELTDMGHLVERDRYFGKKTIKEVR